MFLLEKRHPIEADIIMEILKSERILYKPKPIKTYVLPYCPEPIIIGYDIEIYPIVERKPLPLAEG